jgi:hypothetical protein
MLRNAPHQIEVLRSEVLDVVDGRDVLSWSVLARVPGRFTFLDAEESTALVGQVIEASVRIPSWLHVNRADRVQIVNAPEEFLGQWVVENVRPAPGHTRLMLKRAT